MTDLPERTGLDRRIAAFWIALIAVAIAGFIWLNPAVRSSILSLSPLLTSFLVVLSCWGWGAFPRRFARPENLVDWLQGLAFGIGLTGIFVLVTGLAGLLDPLPLAIWFLIGNVVALFVILRHRPRIRFPRLRSWWDGLALVVLVIFIVPNLPYVVAPESTTDALEYHLLIPQTYLLEGAIEYLPHFVESNYPSLSEYVNALILSFSNDRAAKCFHFWITLAVLGMITVLSRHLKPESSGLLAPALYVSMPVVVSVSGLAWNDMLFTLFVLLTIERLLVASERELDSRMMVEAAVFAALASWTKYTFAMFLFALILLFMIGIRRWKWRIRPIVIFGLVLAGCSSVWWAKNWVLTGNPVYPFLNTLFQSPYWTPAADSYFRLTLTRYEIPEWGWTTYLTFPFHLTISPRIVDTHTGLIPLVLLPVIFAGKTRAESLLRTLTGTWFVVWLFIQTETRSLLAILAVIIVLIGTRLPSLEFPERWSRRLFRGMVVLILALNITVDLVITEHLYDPIDLFIGAESEKSYLLREVESYPAYQYLNESDHVNGVLLVGVHNPYHLQRPTWFSSCCDPPIVEALVQDSADVDELERFLKSLGITHILFNQKGHRTDLELGLYSWSTEERERFNQFINEKTRPVWQQGDDVIVELRDMPRSN